MINIVDNIRPYIVKLGKEGMMRKDMIKFEKITGYEIMLL